MQNDRKKELKRQYQESSREIGVCRVLNISNGRSLVEASRDVAARLSRHQAELKLGTHRNKSLRQDWTQFGPAAFRFEIVEVLEPLDDPDYDPDSDLEVMLSMCLERMILAGEEFYPPR